MASFAQAARLHFAGRSDTARRLYCQVLEREPRHFGALNNLGVLAFCARDLATARTMLERAAAHPDHNAVCHAVLAATLLLLGAVDRAQEELNRAQALDPRSAEPLYFVGVALKERGSSRDAIVCLEHALRLNPAHEGPRNDLGLALFDAGLLEEAKECFEQVNGAMGLANLAAFLQADQRCGESLACAERAAKVAERSAEGWIALGNARCCLGRHDEAAKAYSRASELGTHRNEFAQNLLFMRHYTGGLTVREHAAQHVRWAERFAWATYRATFARIPWAMAWRRCSKPTTRVTSRRSATGRAQPTRGRSEFGGRPRYGGSPAGWTMRNWSGRLWRTESIS